MGRYLRDGELLQGDDHSKTMNDECSDLPLEHNMTRFMRLRRSIARALLPPSETKFFHSLQSTGIKNNHAIINDFVESFNPRNVLIDLGSGNRRLASYALSLDYTPFEQVDVVGDVSQLPFCSDSVDGVVVQEVLEHVPDPFRVMREIQRILKPGGRIYAEVPFMYVQHGQGYPDYYRFTLTGLEHLCKDFYRLKSGVCMGPGSGLSLILRRYLRERTSNTYVRYVIGLVTGWMTFWLKYVDDVIPRGPSLHHIASALYYVGRKEP